MDVARSDCFSLPRQYAISPPFGTRPSRRTYWRVVRASAASSVYQMARTSWR